MSGLHCRICGSLSTKEQRICTLGEGVKHPTETLPPTHPRRLPPRSGSQGPGVQKEGNKSSPVSMWTPSTTARLEEVHCPGQWGDRGSREELLVPLAPPPSCPAEASKSLDRHSSSHRASACLAEVEGRRQQGLNSGVLLGPTQINLKLKSLSALLCLPKKRYSPPLWLGVGGWEAPHQDPLDHWCPSTSGIWFPFPSSLVEMKPCCR